jgi:hypothetical protein
MLTLEVAGSDARLGPSGGHHGKPLAASWAQPDRATFSTDQKQWKHSAPGVAKEGIKAYAVAAEGSSLWLAWGPPFTPADSAQLIASLDKGHRFAQAFELAKSNGSRPCPAVRLRSGHRDERERPAVWLQARQHAWESGSSWVCRGAAEWLASDERRAERLREKCEIFIVPIMDIDSTAMGNGGKEQIPQDHNRDWTDKPHHAEVAAAQQRLLKLAAEKRLALFVDLHNPGPNDKQPFFYFCPEETLAERGRQNLDRFFSLCRGEMDGPLDLSSRPRVSGAAYDPLWKQMSKNWVTAHSPPHTVAVTLETSWNTPASTTDGYRKLGAQLASAIERYFREDPVR